ncbi:hypothetical protein JCM9957A_00130 [Kineosporia succinea]
MNAVIGMSGLMMDTPLDAQQREFAQTIRDSGEALLTVINDILDFSKIESGSLDLEEHPFELDEAVDSAAAVMALAASRKGLELVVHVDPRCPPVLVGDVTRFRQVIVNLLSNAVKFTERGEVLVDVSRAEEPVAPDQPERVTLRVQVRDTGIGIPADRTDRLFQPFSQVDSSTTRVHGGTGLGLVISRRLARAQGGDLVAESTPASAPRSRSPPSWGRGRNAVRTPAALRGAGRAAGPGGRRQRDQPPGAAVAAGALGPGDARGGRAAGGRRPARRWPPRAGRPDRPADARDGRAPPRPPTCANCRAAVTCRWSCSAPSRPGPPTRAGSSRRL